MKNCKRICWTCPFVQPLLRVSKPQMSERFTNANAKHRGEARRQVSLSKEPAVATPAAHRTGRRKRGAASPGGPPGEPTRASPRERDATRGAAAWLGAVFVSASPRSPGTVLATQYYTVKKTKPGEGRRAQGYVQTHSPSAPATLVSFPFSQPLSTPCIGQQARSLRS